MVVKLSRRSRKARPLETAYDWKKIEKRVRRYYADRRVRKKIAKAVAGSKPLGYVDGPPTLNNQPHVGHVRGRMMKDVWYRYKTMGGENIVFRGGWDTQGLPVELQAEKEMGLTGNKAEDLKRVGMEKLVEACKALIQKYKVDWEEADNLLGLMIDHDKAYMTYRDAYIEREWKYLETAWKRELLGEGFKVVPYCPRCQTALSAAEVSLGGYENLEDPSLYYKAKMEDGSFLVLWTTMPFTVVTDELVGVKPDSDYEFVKVGTETWVVNSGRKDALQKDLGILFGETVKKVKGKELEGLQYTHPLLEEIPGLSQEPYKGKVHRVIAEDYVDVETGTGLVHISPANGEEDFAVAQRRGVPVFAPFDDQVKFTPEAGRFEGFFARDADAVVVQELERRGSLVHAGKIMHDYPVCWRSNDRLVWLARREYFYWVDRIREKLVKAAEGVEYFFEAPRNRFVSSVGESPSWCITRERVWGTPLPIWVCEGCGHKTGAFSRKRILKLATETPDGPHFELHRPWIDRVVLRCPECGGRAVREPFVLDTWHDSGSSPYSSFTDAEFKKLVPVDFLTEGIDQTRGWAYTLLVLNVILSGKPSAPYRKFLFQGHVLDEKGQKMSKSLGNVVQGLDLLRNYSVDGARLYMLSKASPEDAVSLDLKEIAGRPFQVLNTLYHLHVYLLQNGAVDGYQPGRHTVAWAAKRNLLGLVDRWLLAKLTHADKAVLAAYGSARFNEAAKTLEELVINHLSQTYVRLVRGELWKDEPKERNRRLAIYAVLGEGLRRADELLHPVSPFVTEELYQETFAARRWSRPLLSEGWGAAKWKRSEAAETLVDFSLEVEEACNSARTKARLKRRWPLRSLMVLVAPETSALARRAGKTVALLCNVKKVEVKNVATFPATFRLKPNPSRVGAIFKESTRDVLGSLRPLEGKEALRTYWSGKPVATGKVEVPLSAFSLEVASKEGYQVAEKGRTFVAISKERDGKLVAEGLVRDLARRLQALRKENGFVPTAMLGTASVAGLEKEDLELITSMTKQIAFLVRVRKVELLADRTGKGWSESDLDGKPVYLKVW